MSERSLLKYHGSRLTRYHTVCTAEIASSQRARQFKVYYADLYPGPPLISRSSATLWEAPSGAEGYNRPKGAWVAPWACYIIRLYENILATVGPLWCPARRRGSGPPRTSPSSISTSPRSTPVATKFEGNVIDLGTQNIHPDVLTRMVYLPPGPHTFEYPPVHLLSLKGTIPDEDVHHLLALDQNGETCLMVHSNTTGLTVGRANDLRSRVRNYYEDGTTSYSMEWTILPFDNKSGAFSAPGDSGAILADGSGRIGGIIAKGAGRSTAKDVTCITSIHSLTKGIKAKFPKAHLDAATESIHASGDFWYHAVQWDARIYAVISQTSGMRQADLSNVLTL
ncbi:hypothetical protein M0805_005725 [Coniferiporia weirii]|nr:hypothetical protein M0805_005725 [Coniferiporia weirii]